MKKKVSDYIADFLAKEGITDCFAVTGGSAMHLNDSFGHHDKIKCTYFHHEQAAALAAEAYARVSKNTSVYPLNALRGVYPEGCIVKSVDKVVKRI